MFAGYLDTKGLPDPDLLIRTSGEKDFLTLCFGSLLIPNFILRMFCGRILIKKNYKKRLIIITKETVALEEFRRSKSCFYSFNQWDYLSACCNFLLCSGRLFSAFCARCFIASWFI